MQNEVRRSTKEVTVKLDDAETVALARKASQVRLAKLSLESEFTRVKTAYKGRIEEKDSEISRLLTAVQEGQEMRIVEVEEHFNFNANTVEVREAATGRILDTRAFTADERQIQMDFPKAEPAQGTLPLGDPSAPMEVRHTVELAAPETIDQEVFIAGDDTRVTIVKSGLKEWRQEVGEAARYVAVAEEVYGAQVLSFERVASFDVAPTPPAE